MPDYNRKINTVPNQRVITTNKSLCDEMHRYTINNLEALDKAAALLKEKASFKLYMYMAKHQHNYKFALSSKHFMEWSGCGIKSYTTAFNELVDKGFLVLQKGTQNLYNFYDTPHIQKDQKIVRIIKSVSS